MLLYFYQKQVWTQVQVKHWQTNGKQIQIGRQKFRISKQADVK